MDIIEFSIRHWNGLLDFGDPPEYEVLPYINGKLVFDRKDHYGLDPELFFREIGSITDGRKLIGLCTCGCEGCDDYPVKVTVEKDTVLWDDYIGDVIYRFDLNQYKTAVENCLKTLAYKI